jgi:preprotein translocase subunit SecB
MQNNDNNNQAIFGLDKLYLKDASIEVPNAPQIFLEREQPKIDLNLQFNTIKIDDGIYETVLNAKLDAKIGQKQMFLIELEQAGIFQIKNIPNEQLELIQNIDCPNLVFPYLREAVSDLTAKAGFMPIVLAPVNFSYLYQQKKQSEQQEEKMSIN